MQHRRYLKSLVVGIALAALCTSLTAFAQRARGAQEKGKRDAARIRIIDIKLNYRKSPLFQDVSVPGAKREYEWLQIILEYETAGGKDGVDNDRWVDELTLDWYVVFIRGRRAKKPVLMTTTVTYVDVVEGTHHAVIYVRPRFIQRYTGRKRVSKSDIGVHVEAKIGESAAEYDYVRGKFPDKWWESKKVLLKPGEVLNRLETPFAPLDYDYFQHIKLPPR